MTWIQVPEVSRPSETWAHEPNHSPFGATPQRILTNRRHGKMQAQRASFDVAQIHSSTTRQRVSPRNLRHLTYVKWLKIGNTLAGASCL